MPSIRCCSVFAAGVFFFSRADFFFAKRLFFRYGEGGEGRASRATVGVTAKDNGGACFPLDFGITPTKGRQPSHPHRSGFFCSFHATCVPTCEWLATTDPPRLIGLAAAGSKLRFRLRLSLAWSCPQYAISDGELEIAKGRLFCNQIPHNPFINKILIRVFATKNFKEKTFPNHPSTP